MDLAKVIEQIVATHPMGVQRKIIELEMRNRQTKSSSPATIKRALAKLVAQNRIIAEGRSVARTYRSIASRPNPIKFPTLTQSQIVISNCLLDEVKSKAEFLGLSTLDNPKNFIEAVLRDWLENPRKQSPAKRPGHEDRVQWVYDCLKGQAEDGKVGPVGAKRLAKDILKLNPARKLGPTFVKNALKELVQRGDLHIEVERAGSVGCIYKIR